MTSLTLQRLDRSQVRHNLDQFKALWRKRLDEWAKTGETGIEKRYAQSFWIDFLDCFGISAARVDLFEQDARRASTGGLGYIDLFWPGVVIGEAKSPGIDLQIAVDQARDYLQGGSVTDTEQPRYIIATDFDTFRLLRLGDPEQRFDVTFSLLEVTDHLDQLRFLAGFDDSTSHEEEEAASLQASKLMAELFTAMVGDDVDEDLNDQAPINPEDEDEDVQKTSVFLTRLIFLLFGDDAGLWEQDLFYRFVLEQTTPENLGSQIDALFDVLNTPENRRKRVPESMDRFPYVNGSLFDREGEKRTTTFFSPSMRAALLNACRFHWTDISPAIFGSLFQLVKSKEARRSDGEHYTSEKNILKTLGPLFLDQVREEADRLIKAKSTSVKKLREFRDQLAEHIFIDPACGSGNFLIVAYRELRKIETDIIVAIREREGESTMSMDITWEQKISIGQFYGIELNWWPAKIAETAMFLVDHQANRELADRVGLAPDRLPITITAHIHHGNALAVDWREILPESAGGLTYVFGNPPFAGHKERSKEQGELLKKAWGTIFVGHLDFVTAWFVLAMDLLADRKGEFAFVATNSIVQGESVAPIFDRATLGGWAIKFAYRPFVWDSEAPGKAAVHCVIVGYSRLRNEQPKLFGPYSDVPETPNSINPYLIPGPPVLAVHPTRKPLSVALTILKAGSTPIDWDNLVVTEKEYDEVYADPIARKYLRPYVGGEELINGLNRWCLWMAESDTIANDLKSSKLLRVRVEAVAVKRAESKRIATNKLAKTPYLFGENRQPDVDYLALPQSFTERRLFATASRLPKEVIASVKLFTVEDPDGFFFSLISSSMFITWQKTVGGRIKSDPSVSSSLVWNTFPVPDLEDKARQQIIDAGKKVLAARELHPERSLAEHYNPLAMAPELLKAHDALDKEVDKAMGAPRKLSTERQRQEILFANYSKLTNKFA